VEDTGIYIYNCLRTSSKHHISHIKHDAILFQILTILVKAKNLSNSSDIIIEKKKSSSTSTVKQDFAVDVATRT
jgi:hypothetical protein